MVAGFRRAFRLCARATTRLAEGRWAAKARVILPNRVVELVEHGGITYAQIIWAGINVEETRFFSPPQASFQFGLLAHRRGYREAPHFHKAAHREIDDLQQMFVVQRGIVDVELYSDEGRLFRMIRLAAGDAIVLIHGIHAIHVIEDFQALSVKQGPFLGDEEDKVEVVADRNAS